MLRADPRPSHTEFEIDFFISQDWRGINAGKTVEIVICDGLTLTTYSFLAFIDSVVCDVQADNWCVCMMHGRSLDDGITISKA